MFRKIIVIVLLAVTLTACSPNLPDSSGGEATLAGGPLPSPVVTESPVKATMVGFVAADANFSWSTSFKNAYEERVANNGWKAVSVSADNDVENQIAQIRELIYKKVDYLIVVPIDSRVLASVLKEARVANIPIVIAGTDLDGDSKQFVTSICYQNDSDVGKNGAELMLDALKGKPGKKIFVIETQPEQSIMSKRWEGMRPVFEKEGIQVVVDRVVDRDAEKVSEVIKELVAQIPQIDGIFSTDAAITPAIIQALDEAKIVVPVIGSGGNKAEVELIKAGKLYGTTCQSASASANLVMDVIDSLSSGLEVEPYVYLSMPKVTLENIDTCPGDW